MKRIFLLALILSISHLTAPAFADGGKEGAIEVGPYVGYTIFDDYNGLEPKNRLFAGGRLGYFINPNVSFEPSFQMLLGKTDTAVAGTTMNLTSARFNLLYNFMDGSTFRPFVTGGLGLEHTKFTGSSTNDLGVNLGAGFRYFFTDQIAARVDGRYIYAEVGSASPVRVHNFEMMGGVSFFFGGKDAEKKEVKKADADGDGVEDGSDKCPDTQAGATVDASGCPSDDDGDGVWNGIDKCPDTAKGVTVDATGCVGDADGDGVVDSTDQCPDTAKDTPVDAKGCPIEADADKDGVVDSKDKCPATPEGVKVTEDGCPMDSDADGVTDNLDKCAETPAGTKVDEAGCPPEVAKARGVLKGVNFKTSSAVLTDESKPILDEVAKTLGEFPKVRVEVQGHTDDRGQVATNMKLSKGRAETVRDYLVSKGVDASRLEVKGFGSSKPLVPNTTPANRKKNRRVELNWLD